MDGIPAFRELKICFVGWMMRYSAAKHVQHRIRNTMDSWNTEGRVLTGKTGEVVASLMMSP